ncbi:MAG: SpoIIE family protein phosphatase [Deferribacterales bacterium]
MKKILIFTKKSNFFDTSDILCGLMSSFDTVSDADECISILAGSAVSGLLLDASGSAEECFQILSDMEKQGIYIHTAVYITDDKLFPEFSAVGVTSFLTEKNVKRAICSVFGLGDDAGRKNSIVHRLVNRLRSLAESLEQGVILLDSDNRIVFANKAGAEMTKMSVKDIMKKRLDDVFLSHPYAPESKESSVYEQKEHTLSDGTVITLDSTITPAYEKDEFSGNIIIFSKPTGHALDREKELELLRFQEKYHSTQQAAAFKKQMLVIKDEVSGTVTGRYGFETYFKPLDIMSGDIYGSINIKDGRCLLYIIDAMGKGLSASVTALQSSSFINHSVEMSIIKNDFSLSGMLTHFIHYIRDRIMDEEALCAVFALIDTNTDSLYVSSFGMPPILACHTDGTVTRLKTPNMPIMRFMANKEITKFPLTNIDKLLIYSDGLSESVDNEGSLFFSRLPEVFAASGTKKHFLKRVNSEITTNDDDMTFFFISTLPNDFQKQESFSVKSSLTEIEKASEKVFGFMRENSIEEDEVATFEFAMQEMLMNALEHGSFGISFSQKQEMIASGNYDSVLSIKSSGGSPDLEKPIDIICRLTPMKDGRRTLMITISDTGQGFSVSEIFKFNSFDGNLCHAGKEKYNGRGIFITDNLVDGLFYNERGNTVHIIRILDSQQP